MANVIMFSPPPPPPYVDQRVHCCGAESLVVPSAPVPAMGVKIKIVVQEMRRLTTMRTGTPAQILEENLVRPQQRERWLLFDSFNFHPDAIASVVAFMITSIPNILPHHRSRVSSQVSDNVINALSTTPLVTNASLQIKSLIRVHTTHSFQIDHHHLAIGGGRHRALFRNLQQELAPPPSVQQQEQQPPSVNTTTLAPSRRVGPLPASLASIQNMPSKSYQSSDSDDCCPVCLEDFSEGCRVSEMPCSHIFHKSCIVPWLLLRNTCPSCRFKMPTD